MLHAAIVGQGGGSLTGIEKLPIHPNSALLNGERRETRVHEPAYFKGHICLHPDNFDEEIQSDFFHPGLSLKIRL
jgi:hypothetical protein